MGAAPSFNARKFALAARFLTCLRLELDGARSVLPPPSDIEGGIRLAEILELVLGPTFPTAGTSQEGLLWRAFINANATAPQAKPAIVKGSGTAMSFGWTSV
jgi:hypothetical protein